MKYLRFLRILLLLLVVGLYAAGYGQARSDSSLTTLTNDSLGRGDKTGWMSIQSAPTGAEVYDGSKFIGVTPLDSVPAPTGVHILRLFYPSARFWNAALKTDTLDVSGAEVKSSLVQFAQSSRQEFFMNVVPTTVNNPNLFLASSQKGKNRAWLGYAAGGTMIAAGALSAYLKTNSDNYFNTYLGNRDPNLLSKVRRLDRWAGVSLFISEISFGLVTYLLLLE